MSIKEKKYDLSVITKKDVNKAIKYIDDNGFEPHSQSTIYDLRYNGKAYPPKLVLSLAYGYASGKNLDRSVFAGGKDTECFNTLMKLGFTIVEKKGMTLLYNKELDFSLFTEGFTIPNDVLPLFVDIFGKVTPGTKRDIEIDFNDDVYKAEFRHVNIKDNPRYQIRYPKNGNLSQHLKIVHRDAFEILNRIRESSEEQKKTFAKLPDNRKEYIMIYYNALDDRLVFKQTKTKMNFITIIKKFIAQADEASSLKVNDYPKEYDHLRVVVSFGKGNFAQIPWISFLYEGQETNNGIYPVLLYYKDRKRVVLAYGVSEENKSQFTWTRTSNMITINEYFLSNRLGRPARYGASYVYKVYDPDKINGSNIDEDLQQIILEYKELMENSTNSRKEIESEKPFDIHAINEIKKTGLIFSNKSLYRYAVSLLTKPFVILSGLSGSGKTQLALAFARWMSRDSSQIRIVSVGADWNNREYLLGYPNALDCGKYVSPENGVLDFILEASNNSQDPYFLILDEMNLSYVERYFADFLSTMESGECIMLHPATSGWSECHVPAQIKLPKNLFITGTINVDETTYMFSPKVLDRANVIEFRISEEEMGNYLSENRPLNLNMVNHLGAAMGNDFIRVAIERSAEDPDKFRKVLLSFFNELQNAGAEFGYRTVSEILRFINIANKLNVGWSIDELIDIVVMQKMLPKLHGSRKKMQPILASLWNLCLSQEIPEEEKILIENDNIAKTELFRYPLSATKIWHMNKNARENGFASYAEA